MITVKELVSALQAQPNQEAPVALSSDFQGHPDIEWLFEGVVKSASVTVGNSEQEWVTIE